MCDRKRRKIDKCRSIIDDCRVTLKLASSFMIVIYDRNIFIVKATSNLRLSPQCIKPVHLSFKGTPIYLNLTAVLHSMGRPLNKSAPIRLRWEIKCLLVKKLQP